MGLVSERERTYKFLCLLRGGIPAHHKKKNQQFSSGLRFYPSDEELLSWGKLNKIGQGRK